MFFTVLPLVYLFVRASDSSFADFLHTVTQSRSIELLINSVALVGLVTLSATVIGTAQAFIATKTTLTFATFIGLGAVLPLAIPSYINAFSWMSISSNFQGLFAAWFVLTVGTSPYVFLAVTAALLTANSHLEDVARSLGQSPRIVFTQVLWPTIRPAVFASGLVVALYTLSDFGAVSLLRYDTFTRGIFNSYRSSFDRTTAAQLAILVVALSVALVWIQQRSTQHNATTRTVSRRQRMALSTRWNLLSLTLALWTLVGVGVPVATMIRWTIVGASDADTGQLQRALINTVGYAIAGGLAATFFAVAVALVAYRYRTRIGALLERSMWTAHALPGIVIALSFVFLANSSVPTLYQTSVLMVVVYVALFLPNAVSAMELPVASLPSSLDDVARSLGSSRLRLLWSVIIPNLRAAMVASFSLVALTILKELPATLLLRPTGIETLATRLWTATSINAFSAAAPYALTLVLLGGIPALLLNRQVRSSLRSERM